MDLRRQITSPGRLCALAAGLCLCLASCATATPPVASSPAGPASRAVTDVTASRHDATTVINVGVSARPSAFYTYKETSPLGVVVELPGIEPGATPEPLAVNDGLVTTVSRSAVQINGAEGTRLQIALAEDVSYEVQRLDGRLQITLSPQGAGKGAAEPEVKAEALPQDSTQDSAAEGAQKGAAEAKPEAATGQPEASAIEQARTGAGTGAGAPDKAAAEEPVAEKSAAEEPAAKPEAKESAEDSAESFMADKAESAAGSPCRIRGLDFKCLPGGKCRVVVTTTAKAGYELARISRDTLLLTLRRATLPEELGRALDTSQFPTAALDAVSPRQAGRNVILSLRFRQVVPYHLMQDGTSLTLEFDAAKAGPSPQIALAGRSTETPEDEAAKAAATEQAAERKPPAEAAEAKAAPAPQEDSQPLPGSIKVVYPGMQRHFSGQRITLDFQNADVHNVLRLIAEVSGLNVITSDEVKGRVTMRLQKIPWDQALDIVLATCNLAMSRTGNVIRIAPATRFHDEQKQADEAAQDALDAMRKKEQLVPLVTERIRVNYAKAAQMKDRVSDVLSGRGKASFDERTNTVIIRDVAESVATAKDLIGSLDWPTPQVVIEARIVEATTNFSREIGTQWGANFNKTFGGIDGTVGVQGRSGVSSGGTPNVPFLVNLPTTTTFGGLGFTFSKLSGALDIDARLLASEKQGKLHIISTPRISTLDNTEAYIQQGEDIPYLSQSVDGISTQFVQTALKLTVTPHITPDGRVRMKIKAEKSEPSDRIVNGTPGILRKETLTEVLVNHGETVVIGGILKDTKRTQYNRIPFFHQVPFLGWLFKSENKSDEKQELLIFITPKIVSMEARPST